MITSILASLMGPYRALNFSYYGDMSTRWRYFGGKRKKFKGYMRNR